PPPSTESPEAPGGEASPAPPRPVVHGRDQHDPASAQMVLVLGQPADAASLAPWASPEEVDLPAWSRRWEAPDQRGGSSVDLADGEGESPVGVREDPARA